MMNLAKKTIWLAILLIGCLALYHYAFGADKESFSGERVKINEAELRGEAKRIEKRIKEWSDENLSNIIKNMEGVLKAERLPDSETRMVFKRKRKRAEMKLILAYIQHLREIYKELGYFSSPGSGDTSRDDTAMWDGGTDKGNSGGDGVSGGLSGPGLRMNQKDESLRNAGGDTAGGSFEDPGLDPKISSGPGLFGSDFTGDDILFDDPFYSDPDYGVEVMESTTTTTSTSGGGGDISEQGDDDDEQPGGLF